MFVYYFQFNNIAISQGKELMLTPEQSITHQNEIGAGILIIYIINSCWNCKLDSLILYMLLIILGRYHHAIG